MDIAAARISIRHLAPAVFLVLLAACTGRKPPPHPVAPAPGGIYYEEDLPAPKSTRIEIIGLQQTPTEDDKRVILTGTLVNRGTKDTSELSVKISGLDDQDHVLQSLYAVPRNARLAGGGGTTTFTTTVDNLPGVKRYHVEAIAK